jgi:hypothetical protein
MASDEDSWPRLDYRRGRDSCTTLHLWTQVVGKVRLALAPPVNHWWHVPLYLTARGLTTSPMPYGGRAFQIDFDFIDHRLRIHVSDGGQDGFALVPRSVADFHTEIMGRLRGLGLDLQILDDAGRDRRPGAGSSRITCTPPMTRTPSTGSGGRWRWPTRCSPSSAAGFSAKRARCISSGAASTSRLPGFPAGAPRRRPRAR